MANGVSGIERHRHPRSEHARGLAAAVDFAAACWSWGLVFLDRPPLGSNGPRQRPRRRARTMNACSACPWCGGDVPPKTRGEDRRFCSATCRHRWHATCRKLGEFVLNGWPNSVHGFSERGSRVGTDDPTPEAAGQPMTKRNKHHAEGGLPASTKSADMVDFDDPKSIKDALGLLVDAGQDCCALRSGPGWWSGHRTPTASPSPVVAEMGSDGPQANLPAVPADPLRSGSQKDCQAASGYGPLLSRPERRQFDACSGGTTCCNVY